MLKQIAVFAGLLLAADLACAADKTCPLAVEANDQMQYNVSELHVPAGCTEVEVTLKHVGKLPVTTMGHNFVVARTADVAAIASAGVAAGLKENYLPPNDKRVIAHTKIIGGGESTSVKFPVSKLPKGGDYSFFCSFPGHYALMKGKLIVD